MSLVSKVKPADIFFPDPFPALWASDWGEDEQGLWMAFTYKDVRQAFRWIAPGTFMMGSPDDELEREDDEVLHEVTLTKGYWLAETACSQALWQAVMDENPSHFTEDKDNPVEQVSWHDVQDFMVALNAAIPGLKSKLPTEAQWEYACRAGTITPFSFGENITPDQVNYDGSYPYADGAKGKDRNRTVPVGSLKINPWGLYEMHGNVWEWCQGCYGDYGSEKVVDPKGADKGTSRVLRGGSWIYGGRDARSAYRGRNGPGSAGRNVGFRLALGQQVSAAEQHT